MWDVRPSRLGGGVILLSNGRTCVLQPPSNPRSYSRFLGGPWICVMLYFWWGCRGNLNVITLDSERVKGGQVCKILSSFRYMQAGSNFRQPFFVMKKPSSERNEKHSGKFKTVWGSGEFARANRNDKKRNLLTAQWRSSSSFSRHTACGTNPTRPQGSTAPARYSGLAEEVTWLLSNCITSAL